MAQSGRNGLRALIGLVAIGAFFAAATLAASRHAPVANPEGKEQTGRTPKPAIVSHPEAKSPSTSARFDFTVRAPGALPVPPRPDAVAGLQPARLLCRAGHWPT